MTSAEQATALLDKVQPGDAVSLVVQTPDGQRRIVNVRAR